MTNVYGALRKETQALAHLSHEPAAMKPLKVARVIARLVVNPFSYLQVKSLLRNPIFAEAANAHPRMRYKHLTDNYLVRDLSLSDRIRCYVHHHSRLLNSFDRGFLRGILLAHETIWSHTVDAHQLSISLELSTEFDKEGEHSLHFWYDGALIYVLSFTIVPENIVSDDAREAVLICRLQGMRETYRKLSEASRLLSDVPIPIVLVSALAGICEALKIDLLGCVSAEQQSSYSVAHEALFRKSYDDFMDSIVMSRNSHGYFASTLPLPYKAMTDIKQGHKIRTRKKRVFREQIIADCAGLIRSRMLKQS